MNLKKHSLVIILALSMLAACKKNTSTDNDTGTKIYAAGAIKVNGEYTGAYWKNGALNILAGKTSIYSMTVQGNDIYVAGDIYENGNNIACYWKNGVITKLANTTEPTGAYAIAVNGNDVHVVGYKGLRDLIYWKNGVATTLFGNVLGFSAPNSIKIYGNDIYIAGIIPNDKRDGYVAAYWKNGVLNKLPDNGKGAAATDIVVEGNDVYVGGNTMFPNNAVYWKNGTLIKLSTVTDSYVSNIAVKGTDVYAVGANPAVDNTGASTTTAALWKNNVLTLLGDGLTPSSAKSISLNGNDVYVGGYKSPTQATYWKNGTATQLSSSESQIAQIVVVSN
jgi:hypothetical protein